MRQQPASRCRGSRLLAPHSRRGMVVIAALTCLLIVISLVGTMLQSALRARRQLHAERDRRQVELLVEASADRARLRLAQQPTFRGDTWELPAESIVGHGAGRVTTEVLRGTNQDNSTWQVRVVAEYPLDRDLTIRRSHVFPVAAAAIQSEE